MDTDSPHPHCPFCGLPMHFRRGDPNVDVDSVLTAFDCKWCGVVLNVSPRAEVLQLAAPIAGVARN
jgi:transposase-like protein